MDGRDARISDIFYYFEEHTSISTGRTVGRKIGVVQELMCKKLLLSSSHIRDSVIYEPRIPGRSGATHKVEFVIFQPLEVCNVPVGGHVDSARVDGLSMWVSKVDPARKKISLTISHAGRKARCTVDEGRPVNSKVPKEMLESDKLQMKVWINENQSARIAVLDLSSPRASIESKRVGAQRFAATEKLGSGIQTIEKAKQASLVAVDFDLLYNEMAMALSGREAERNYRGFVILGNGVHWTDHDLSILDTYVDCTYLVRDQSIIRYADYVRREADSKGEDFFRYFMSYFKGLTTMEADDFSVDDSDFVPLRPQDGPSLKEAVLKQIADYPITDV